MYVQGSLSIYDTSAENTGKIISTDTNGGILTYNGAREINLYNGTGIGTYTENLIKEMLKIDKLFNKEWVIIQGHKLLLLISTITNKYPPAIA